MWTENLYMSKRKNTSLVSTFLWTVVITVPFAGFFCSGVMDRGKGTGGVNDAPVCSCRLRPSQVQFCSLFVIPGIQSPLKSLQKNKFCRCPQFRLHFILIVFAKIPSNTLFHLQVDYVRISNHGTWTSAFPTPNDSNLKLGLKNSVLKQTLAAMSNQVF